MDYLDYCSHPGHYSHILADVTPELLQIMASIGEWWKECFYFFPPFTNKCHCQDAPQEGWRLHQPKPENNNQDENSSSDNSNNINFQSLSQKFKNIKSCIIVGVCR